jgi:hypothetical protein
MPFPPKDSSFEYRHLTAVGTTALDTYCNRTLQRYALQTKNWSKEKNAEWLVRIYLADKMILSATVLVNAVKYSCRKNLKIVEPYLCYYSMLCCCRSILFTLPDVSWNGGELMIVTHSKAINLAVDTLRLLDKNIAANAKEQLIYSRSLREMYSYRFPAQGLDVIPQGSLQTIDTVIHLCALLCETAQLNSELLEASIKTNVQGKYFADDEIFKSCFEYRFERGSHFEILFDEDDWRRLGTLVQKEEINFSLANSMSEGMVEDFFFSWGPKDDNLEEDIFDLSNSCREWGVIFPVP